MSQKPRLLIIEDEPAIVQGLLDVFVFHGYEVDLAMDGRQGLDKALTGQYCLILLDVMLPSLDGFTICDRIRQQDREQPIIMLTAKSTEEDIINGLSLGADDYLGKPFSVRELVLRVSAVLKRSGSPFREDSIIEVADGIRIDCKNLLQLDCSPARRFTRREVRILQYLQNSRDRPVSREELLTKVWGYRQADSIETRTVDIHIAKLRRKIEADPKQPRYLLTIRGEGYRLLPSAVL